MAYGAKESNPKEGMGLLVFVAGLASLSAGWAYAPDGLQIILVIAGIAGMIGGAALLGQARAAA